LSRSYRTPRLQKRHEGRKKRSSMLGISTVLFTIVVVVLVIIAGAGFGLYFLRAMTPPTTSSNNYEIVTGLAFAHWTAIGDANLSATMSQYSSTASLWWYVHNSPLNTTSGPYTGSAISSTWTKFFSNGPSYWTVYNYSVVFLSASSAKVTADLWYVLGHGNNTHTLYLPYELDYNYQNGQWYLTQDWWGLPNAPGVVYSGVVSPSSTHAGTTTTTTATASITTSSTKSATPGGYGY
jgi:hypothetical protein